MGLKGRMRDWRAKQREQSIEREMRLVAPVLAEVLAEAASSRWAAIEKSLTFDQHRVLRAKWHLDMWTPGHVPPRPRSTDEVVDRILLTKADVLATDWALVDLCRERRRTDKFEPDFLTVPIGLAQAWWDWTYAWCTHPDGTTKTTIPAEIPESPMHSLPNDLHEIEDEESLRNHMLEVHLCTYARYSDGLTASHEQQHRAEAEDRWWDLRLRPQA